jgi:hypothetical protein
MHVLNLLSQCRFKHDGNSTGQPGKASDEKGVGFSWQKTKSCVKGDSCRLSHSDGSGERSKEQMILGKSKNTMSGKTTVSLVLFEED